jgi:hypothetical protein
MIRVEEREQVSSGKVAVIARSASLLAEPVLQWRQGTDPAAEFYKGSPEDRRQVDPEKLAPSQAQQSSEQDKEDKCEVYQEDHIGQEESCTRPCRHKDPRALFFRLLLRIELDQTVTSVAERLDFEDAPAELKGACHCRAVEHERKIAGVRRFQLPADEARIIDT